MVYLYGDEVEVDAAFCTTHPELDWAWAAFHLLPANLRDEYDRQAAALRAEFERQEDALQAQYKRDLVPPQDMYQRLANRNWADFKRQTALIWREYELKVAALFGRLIT